MSAQPADDRHLSSTTNVSLSPRSRAAYGPSPLFAGIDGAIAAVHAASAAGGRPRVHALMAPVVQPLAANIAAALRIDVSMSVAAEEVAAMAPSSAAILVNLGMLDAERRGGALAAARSGRPFVLDPVKVDRSPARLAFARELLAFGPKVVKGNPGELAALGPVPGGTVTVTTGATDVIRRGGDTLSLRNGTALLDLVIGTGCAAGFLIAAKLAGTDDPFLAAAAALSHLNIAAERAALGDTVGPGTFAVRLIDALVALTPGEVRAGLMVVPPPPDVRLYLVLGPDVPEPVALVREAVAGGVTLVQWRDKAGSTADQVSAVRALVEGCGAPVVVNDRADVAAVAGAYGLHVGHGDLDPSEAARVFGGAIGVTIHSLAEAAAADAHDYAYASVGGVFETASKVNPHPPIGIDGFAAIAAHIRSQRDVPICAIAGIDARRAREVVRAGAEGIAVMSAITKAADPRAAAAALRAAVEEGLAARQAREAAE